MRKTTYVLDTSVYLHDANSIYQFARNDIVVPLKVLEEIDKHKKRQDSVGANARKIIRILDSLREKSRLSKGVRLRKGKGIVYTRTVGDLKELPADLDPSVPDHIIVATALRLSKEGKKVVLVSRDINLRVICDALELKTQDYSPERVVEDRTELYTGCRDVLVDQQDIDRFYAEESLILPADAANHIYPNEFLMLISNSNKTTTALAKFDRKDAPLRKIRQYKNGSSGVWGINPKNKEQNYALDLLLDPEVPIVTLVGKAGCGKTLLAVAAGLEQVLQENIYSRMIVSRPIQPMGRDLGYLPGTLDEKMAPWLAPVKDNLEFLMAEDKENLKMQVDSGKIQIEALTYIRGRSISKAFIIIDEAQNLTCHELKTIITRVGEGTKIILTGDIEQIDNAYIDETSNGLAYAVEKFKGHSLAGHVTLMRGERSDVATLASRVL